MPAEYRAHTLWMLLHNAVPVGDIDIHITIEDISATISNLILCESGYIVSIGVGETSNYYNCIITKTITILH